MKFRLILEYYLFYFSIFRHAHLVAFEKSDLFFMCVLRPISSEIKIDEKEIQAARVNSNFLIDRRE